MARVRASLREGESERRTMRLALSLFPLFYITSFPWPVSLFGKKEVWKTTLPAKLTVASGMVLRPTEEKERERERERVGEDFPLMTFILYPGTKTSAKDKVFPFHS